MSGPGVSDSPNAAFAALSARLSEAGASGLSNELSDIEKFVASKDDANLTAALDRRCRALEGMGLVKVDKVSLNNVPVYKAGQDARKWADALFGPILQIQGGAILPAWLLERNIQLRAEHTVTLAADYYLLVPRNCSGHMQRAWEITNMQQNL